METHAVQIPFTTDARPDTGVYNGKLGMWLFLASEVMLFGALFSAYVLLRSGDPAWPHGRQELNVPLATLNTLILFFSSVMVVQARKSLRLGNLRRGKMHLALTALCGVAFLAIKGVEYAAKLRLHHYPSTSNFFATYFVLTGLHAVHIAGGIVVLAYLLLTADKWHTTNRDRFANRVEVTGLYWHFVDFIWICLFVTLYLL